MKKLVLSALLLFYYGVLMAQAPAPQLDTIRGREVTYHYISQWVDPYDSVYPSWIINPETAFYTLQGLDMPGGGILETCDRYEYAELHVIDDTLSIIGLAVCAGIDPNELNGNPTWRPIADTNPAHAKEYLSLYDHCGNTMNLLAREEFHIYDTVRWMEFGTTWKYADSNYNVVTIPFVYPVIERYFEKPVTVRDSFYVSCTYRTITDTNQIGQQNNYTILYLSTGYFHRMPHVRVAGKGSENSLVPDWIFRDLYEEINMAGSPIFMFPIFDTSGMWAGQHCDSVYGLHQGSVWDNNTMLLWDSIPGQIAWQLAVGRADEDSDSYRIYDLTYPGKAIYNLEYNTTYAARVRAQCDGINNFSPWCDTIQFTLINREGIATAVDRHTHLYPNPASDRIEVFSSFALLRLEVYDLNGRRMLAQDCQGNSATIDASSWPEGTYIAIVRTPAGASSQKLTIKR